VVLDDPRKIKAPLIEIDELAVIISRSFRLGITHASQMRDNDSANQMRFANHMKKLPVKFNSYWQSGTKGKVVILLIGVVLLICVCFGEMIVFAMINESSPTYKATATAQMGMVQTMLAQPTNTPTLTRTPTITYTPSQTLIPTDTTKPTETSFSTNTPTLTDTSIPTNTPASTKTPIPVPTATATPKMLSCSDIESVLNDYLAKLTWEQYHLDGGEVDLYIKSLYGKAINFHGKINDVIGDNVYIDDDSCLDRLELLDIPSNVSILFNKGAAISGSGTVGTFSPSHIIVVNIETYQVEK
jgi:hypothetical protein